MDQAGAGCREKASARLKFQPETLPSPHLRARRFTPAGFYPPKLYIQCPGPNCHPAEPVVRSRLTPPERHVMRPLGACPNSRCSILSESDSTLGYEQVFSPLEYRSDTAAAAECAGLRAERPCLAVYR